MCHVEVKRVSVVTQWRLTAGDVFLQGALLVVHERGAVLGVLRTTVERQGVALGGSTFSDKYIIPVGIGIVIELAAANFSQHDIGVWLGHAHVVGDIVA